jgi:nucleoid-associated protein YgaU
MAGKLFKALLFVTCACAATTAAYLSDVFQPHFVNGPAPKARVLSDAASPVPSRLSVANDDARNGLGRTTADALPLLPSFSLVRVEGNGSVLVAGKASPSARVELDTGEGVIGQAVAGPDGDFIIVLDNALKPGGYRLMLRSIEAHNVIRLSRQYGVVSVPAADEGPVLVLLEVPGRPTQILTMPENALSGAVASRADHLNGSGALADAGARKPVTVMASVQAVEIEGSKIYISGASEPHRKVKVFADEIFLASSIASPDGRFFVEASTELTIGLHVVRVDVFGKDGISVIASATVPFEREPGWALAAVAAPGPDKKADGSEAPMLPDRIAKKLRNVENAVIIRPGDTLWHISRRIYGHGMRYTTIYIANQPKIQHPDRIWPGQIFSIPEQSHEGDAADMKSIDSDVSVSTAQ